MSDIKIRPKTRNIKVRDAAVKHVWQRETENGDAADSAAVREALGEFEGDVKGTTTYSSRKVYQAGKTLAQKRYDDQFKTGKSKTAKQADHSSGDGQPADFLGYDTPQAAKAKQEYRRAKSQRQHKINKREKVGGQRVAEILCQDDALAGKTTPTPGPRARAVFGQNGGAKAFTMPNKKTPQEGGKTQRLIGRSRTASDVPKRTSLFPAAQARTYATRKMQRQMAQETAQKSARTAKVTAKGILRLKVAVIRVGKAIVRTAVGLLGGAGALIALVLVIGGAAAVVGTPFGVFWSGQDADAQSVPQAVAQINTEFTAKINQIQEEHPADGVMIHRIPSGGSDLSITNWTDVVAVFAAKTAGAGTDAIDVVTIDFERIDLLRTIFWDMNEVLYYVDTVGIGEDNETILHITIISKTAEDMPETYHFSKSQKQALTEMLKPEYAQMLAEIVGTYGGELVLTDEQIREILAQMPEDLPADRKAVVQAAYSLLDKVNYFWGGKSHAIGWDNRWGTPAKVTAAGSRTTGTIRPFGLDCSGFVDWVFNNALGYIIGHGGGALKQHGYCTPISWSEALPGDLVFYPGDSHVGVFVGTDNGGSPLIIHCASSQNNVVLTGLQGFSSIGRPDIFWHNIA